MSVSACGNFAFLACANSSQIGMWNLQSGIRRKTFDYQASTALRTIDPEQRGEKTVTGIASDSLNKTLIVSTLAGSLHVGPTD